MRSLLFIDTETTRLDQVNYRIVQLNTRLVGAAGADDYSWRILPKDDTTVSATAAAADRQTRSQATVQVSSIDQALVDFARQLERADLVIGHGVDHSLAAIVNAAKRCGHHNLVANLTHPQFGFDGGRRAPICTQQLAAEYFTIIGEPLTHATTELTTIYRRMLGQPIPDFSNPIARVSACHQLYRFLFDFQRRQDLQFFGDVICFDD